MRETKTFEEFVQEGIVRKMSPNFNRAKNLILESEKRMKSLKEYIDKVNVTDDNANDYIQRCYDIIMGFIRASMMLKGYNSSGVGAHEAEVSYMGILGFNEIEIKFVDQMRYFRNGILYYGTALDAEYAKKVIDFTKKIYPRLLGLIEH